jgi:hypothetical protein
VQFSKNLSPLLLIVSQINLAGSIGPENVMKKKGKGEECMCMRIHPLVKVFSMGEEVGDSIHMSGDMFEDEVKIL